MSDLKLHFKPYKAFIILLVLMFSLSPCSVKRDVLGIFDIQHLSTLNKVKTTVNSTNNCIYSFEKSSKFSALKVIKKLDNHEFIAEFSSKINSEKKIFTNHYSGFTTDNSPPKYILFKRLKLDIA
ncbi:hypothetical protein VUJ46_08740 [Chryseobacterium sp. MYb264]|uniref:hypothetical protein n=1 Tax=Chryseobacterium sp. MYb264 TaxID=2745153 RepID=UPI002E0EA2C6|nr:hypothetical protein VUJ46_08740 [Chryseobacterium sp. MYb264]